MFEHRYYSICACQALWLKYLNIIGCLKSRISKYLIIACCLKSRISKCLVAVGCLRSRTASGRCSAWVRWYLPVKSHLAGEQRLEHEIYHHIRTSSTFGGHNEQWQCTHPLFRFFPTYFVKKQNLPKATSYFRHLFREQSATELGSLAGTSPTPPRHFSRKKPMKISKLGVGIPTTILETSQEQRSQELRSQEGLASLQNGSCHLADVVVCVDLPHR